MHLPFPFLLRGSEGLVHIGDELVSMHEFLPLIDIVIYAESHADAALKNTSLSGSRTRS